MRVALITRLPQIATFLDERFRELGHEPVGVVTTPGPAGRYGDGGIGWLVDGVPRHLDVLVGTGAHRFADLLRALDPDLAFCAGFPVRIPPDALAVPRLGSVNAHPAPLPRLRGPNPIAWALRNGEPEIAYSIHRMDEDFDTGPLLAQGAAPIDDVETPEAFFGRMFGLLIELLPQALARVEAGESGDVQRDEESTYAPFFEPEYAFVDWSRPVLEIHRQVRAWWATASPGGERGPLAELDGARVRLLRTSLDESRGGTRVDCGDGPIWVLEAEPAPEAPR
jgi:methionyl-tRNA formyltransferase